MQTQTTTTTPPDEATLGGLTLADDSGLVGPKVFGELVAREQGRVEEDGETTKAYSSQSVINWVKQGRCKPAATNGRGRLFDPSHAAIVAQNIPTPSRGGARRNSGRKKTDGGTDDAPLTQEMKKAAEAQGALEAFIKRIKLEQDPEPTEAVHVSELLGFTRDELRAVLAVFGNSTHSISPAKVTLLKDLLDLQIKERKLAIDRGELVKKTAMIDAIRVSQRPVIEMLEGLPQTLSSILSMHCWIGSGAVDQLIAMLYHMLKEQGVDTKDHAVSQTLDEVRAMLARPASLDATMRGLIATSVEAARLGLVKATPK